MIHEGTSTGSRRVFYGEDTPNNIRFHSITAIYKGASAPIDLYFSNGEDDGSSGVTDGDLQFENNSLRGFNSLLRVSGSNLARVFVSGNTFLEGNDALVEFASSPDITNIYLLNNKGDGTKPETLGSLGSGTVTEDGNYGFT